MPEPATSGEKPSVEAAASSDGATPVNFETWLGTQPEEVQSMFDTHVGGLTRALQTERESRKTFEKQLKQASSSLEKDSDARKKLDELSGNLSEMQRMNEFYDLAHREGGTNLRLLWLAAKDAGADREGRVNMAEIIAGLKQQTPELFRSSTPAPASAHAGAGTGNSSATTGSTMNSWIRAAAGRS